MKVAISVSGQCFNLSMKAIKRLLDWGVPYTETIDENLKLCGMKERGVTLDPNYLGLFVNGYHHVKDGEIIFICTLKYYPNGQEEWIRIHPLLIKVIEELGPESGNDCEIKIIDIPNDLKWHLKRLKDGSEVVDENYRRWSFDTQLNTRETNIE